MRQRIFILFLIISQALLKAQSPEFHQISDLNNLPCNEIYQIYFDPKGFMWLGTEIGAFRYDGQHFKSYSPNIGSGQALTQYTPVRDQLFVINFLGGVLKLEGDSLIDIGVPKSVLSRNYPYLMCGYDSALWLYGNKGIFRYDELKNVWMDQTPEGLNEDDFSYAKSAAQRHDTMWFISEKSIISISPEGSHTYPVHVQSEHDPSLPRYLLTAGKDNIWMCHITRGDLYYLKDTAFAHFRNKELSQMLHGKKFTNMQELDGKLYFMAYDGLVVYDIEKQSTEWLFRDLPITDLEVDPEGNYWLSTLGYGLLYCSNFNIRSFPSSRMGGSTYKFTHLADDGDGGIYYSRLSGGIGHVNKKSELKEIRGAIQADISTLVCTPEGIVYVAFNNIVNEVIKDRLVPLPPSFPAIKDLLVLEDKYYIASSTGLFIRPSLRNDRGVKRIIDSWCRRVIKGENNTIWIGASDGLFCLKENKVIAHYLPDEGVQDVLWVENENTLYCATMSGKIYKLEQGTMNLFWSPKKTGTQIYHMEWHNQLLWLGTSKGLAHIHVKSGSEAWFDTRDGLSSNIIYDLHIQGKSVWLATGNGLQLLPSSLRKNQAAPILYLESIYKNGEAQHDSLLVLKSTDELELTFTLLSYYSKGEYTLSYSWDNVKWNHLQVGQSDFILSNLPVDATTLWVRGIDSKGQSSEPIQLKTEIHPPYWQSTWFLLLLFFLTVSVVAILFLLYIRQLRKKQEDAFERAELKTNLIESQLTALKAQMNPHFIFNSLNSIYELIVFSETREAATYLNKFATLLRKVLENSEKESLSLTEECEWLSLYLELEKLRFGSDFSYQVNLDKLADPYTIMVPTMLLQPFVENAVKHGLLHKNGIKRLEIEFMEIDNRLICTIRDNGVGRKKAEKYRNARPGNHKSFATGAINRRISMLNDSGKYSISLEIDDLEFPNGKAAGTEVTLKIYGW
ncbi:MAG: hypothetical protein GC180_05810 [Bacteroidetes bacterium]|nr:hypothetical protein [Bacteroidota bacterium]